jgi:hypothetical protein
MHRPGCALPFINQIGIRKSHSGFCLSSWNALSHSRSAEISVPSRSTARGSSSMVWIRMFTLPPSATRSPMRRFQFSGNLRAGILITFNRAALLGADSSFSCPNYSHGFGILFSIGRILAICGPSRSRIPTRLSAMAAALKKITPVRTCRARSSATLSVVSDDTR